jgi:hypothetical protein
MTTSRPIDDTDHDDDGSGDSPSSQTAAAIGWDICLAQLSDEKLIRWWCLQDPTDEGTSVLQGELAEEIERRGLDL